MADFPTVKVQGRVDKVWTKEGVITKLVVDGKWLTYSRNEKVAQPRPAEGDYVEVVCNPWPADSDDPQLYIYNLKIKNPSNGHAATASPTANAVSSLSFDPTLTARQEAIKAAAVFCDSIDDLLKVATEIEAWLMDPQPHFNVPAAAPSQVQEELIEEPADLDSIPF